MAQDFSKAYLNGMKCWERNDYINARKWYEISCNDLEFKKESLMKLIHLDLKEGKYSKARNTLENMDKQLVEVKKLYGLLENIENNFSASKKYYSECMVDTNIQNKSLMALAKLYIQTGDNDVARKMLETLQFNEDFKTKATLSLVCLSILEQNYNEAERLLKSINEVELTPKINIYYQILSMYIKYFLGDLKTLENRYDPIRDYTIYRLFDKSDETLLFHIQKHFNQKYRNRTGCFLPEINLKKLLYEARERMKNMNPNHFEMSDMYRFRLDKPIGIKGSEITRDLCVVTMIDTKDILTMYPVLLSNEFDKEGASTSKELMLKRNYRGQKI